MIYTASLAERAEALARAFAGVAWSMHHGDARGMNLPLTAACWDCDPIAVECFDGEERCSCPCHKPVAPLFAYLDPPYLGATGYGWDMPRAEVLALARRWADAGAVVGVSEAEPLPLEGWHHLELTRPGGKPEWLTLSRAPARVPERQRALFDGAP